MTINIITFRFLENEEVFHFRNKLLNIAFYICNNDSNYKLLLNDSIWSYDIDQKKILENDIQYLDENYFTNWKEISISQSKLLFLLSEKCSKLEIKKPTSLKKYEKCLDFLIINMFEKYDYDKNNNQELIKYLEDKKNNEQCYKELFLTLKEIESEDIVTDNWKIKGSIECLFKYLFNQDIDLFENVFNVYLSADCPFANELFIVRIVNDKKIIERITNNIINSETSKKYLLLQVILDYHYDKKYLPIVKNFIKNQTQPNKYTLSIETILEYSKYCENLLDDYTKDILNEDDYRLSFSYMGSLDDDTTKDIFKSFNNKKILENLYLKSLECSADYKGDLGCLLCINNYDLLNKIIENNSYKHIDKVRKILGKIWNNPEYNNIISYTYNKIIDQNLGCLHLKELFDTGNDKNEKNIKDNQLRWFKDKILEFKDDKNKIYYLFDVIGDKNKKIRKELIFFLLENIVDIEIFKQISFFPSTETWSKSRIPIIERKIEFLQSILNEITSKNDISYIEHINYLNERIKDYQEKIKNVQIEEYVYDFMN